MTRGVEVTVARAHFFQSVLDRGVKLCDGPLAVRLRWRARRRRMLNLQESAQRRPGEFFQRDLKFASAMRKRRRITGKKISVREPNRAAKRLQDIRRQRDVQHLLHRHAANDARRFFVVAVLDRIQRAQTRRNRGVFQLNRESLYLLQPSVQQRDSARIND